jgi:hypothetical protein
VPTVIVIGFFREIMSALSRFIYRRFWRHAGNSLTPAPLPEGEGSPHASPFCPTPEARGASMHLRQGEGATTTIKKPRNQNGMFGCGALVKHRCPTG